MAGGILRGNNIIIAYRTRALALAIKKLLPEEEVLSIQRVLNSVTSPPRWIRQPQLRAMHGVCVCVRACVCVCVSFGGLEMSPPLSFPTVVTSRLPPGATSALTMTMTSGLLPELSLSRPRPESQFQAAQTKISAAPGGARRHGRFFHGS